MNQDEIVDYYMKHHKFPDPVVKVNFPRHYWPDVVVFIWISLLGVPAFLAALYLAWAGAWITLGIIVIAVFVSKYTDRVMSLSRVNYRVYK